MQTHRLSAFLFISFVALQSPTEAFAVESRSDREAVVAPRTKKFYKSNSAKKYFSIGGSYISDYNSKEYQLTSRYLYQSHDFIHEINFQHESNYADTGSGKTKKYNVKKSELYDLMLSSKARLFNSQNYGVFFHRTMYDDLSKYYYDTRTAAGLGRMLFKEKIELDVSLGYHDIKNYGYEVDVITSIRTNFKLTDHITLIQRGYWFFDHESIDNQLKTSFVYRLSDKMSFELRHNFEKRRYEDDNRTVTNQVSRSVTVGLIFDLN